MTNIQDRNVGNRGDVFKHIALLTIAHRMRRRNVGTVRHVETHTFRLDAPLPDPEAWERHAAGLTGADAYRALQAPWIARGRYRCSAGIAADVLGDVRLALAEAHPETRAALAEALRNEGLRVDALVDDADALATVPVPEPAPLLIHLDPFDHPRRYWPLIEGLLARWRLPSQDGCVFAFAYDRAGPPEWPEPPGDLVRVGRWDGAPYALAAWATPELARELRGDLAPLGWV